MVLAKYNIKRNIRHFLGSFEISLDKRSNRYCERVYKGVKIYKPNINSRADFMQFWGGCHVTWVKKQLVSSIKCRGGGVTAKKPPGLLKKCNVTYRAEFKNLRCDI